MDLTFYCKFICDAECVLSADEAPARVVVSRALFFITSVVYIKLFLG